MALQLSLFTCLCLLLVFSDSSSATAFANPQPEVDTDCEEENTRWESSSNTIYITGPATCTLSAIKANLASSSVPLQLVDESNMTWFLGAGLELENGAKLVLYGTDADGDVDELRLKSNNLDEPGNFAYIHAEWGHVDINSTKITSWDEALQQPDTEYETFGRAFIRVRSYLDDDGVTPHESQMDIRNSEVAYLGYYDSESYGLSWKVSAYSGLFGDDFTEVFDIVDVFGTIENNNIHHNYMGIYTYGGYGIQIRNNEVHNNVSYGIDPHDDSDYLVINGNHAHSNGSHGIICSKRCDNLVIRNNRTQNNVGSGIMLHSEVTDSVVENNITTHNGITGISVYDSHNNTIRNNISQFNKIGLRMRDGSSGNLVVGNDLSFNRDQGIYFYRGNDELGEEGRIRLNEITMNAIRSNEDDGIRIRNADQNLFESNTVFDNGRYAVFIEDSRGNLFEKNLVKGNVRDYYYSSSSSGNVVKDIDEVAVGLEDATSSMTVVDSRSYVFESDSSVPTTAKPSKTLAVIDGSVAGEVIQFNRLDLRIIPDSHQLKVLPDASDESTYIKWSAYSENASLAVNHLVGDLEPDTAYDILVNGDTWQTLTSEQDGILEFEYADGYSASGMVFEIRPASAA